MSVPEAAHGDEAVSVAGFVDPAALLYGHAGPGTRFLAIAPVALCRRCRADYPDAADLEASAVIYDDEGRAVAPLSGWRRRRLGAYDLYAADASTDNRGCHAFLIWRFDRETRTR